MTDEELDFRTYGSRDAAADDAARRESEEQSRPGCTTCGHRPSLHRLPEGFTGGPYHPDALYGCVGPDETGCGEKCADFTGNAILIAGRLVDW